MRRELLLCPFCGAVVVDLDRDLYHAWIDDWIEETLRGHLVSEHPIRSRLSRRFRRALAGKT